MKRFITIMILFCLLSYCWGQETGPILCADGIDNDGNGLIDCEELSCSQLPNNGCLRCGSGISFADTILELSHGCNEQDATPEGILGVANWDLAPPEIPEFFFLGDEGYVKLGFTNNLLINSGDEEEDVWVFEVGEAIEPSLIALRPQTDFTVNALLNAGIPDTNGDGYYEIGGVGGSVASFDIDAVIPGYNFGELRFDAIEIRDSGQGVCYPGTPGADIDAVCALYFLKIDCAGIAQGEHELDACGECLLPSDSLWNQSCADCMGTPNGDAVIDFCGECLAPTDPAFNSSCDAFSKIYIPNVFTPNNDLMNDRFVFSAPLGLVESVIDFRIYNRWGELIYQNSNFSIEDEEAMWNGKSKGQDVNSGVYSYLITLEFKPKITKSYRGTVTIIR